MNRVVKGKKKFEVDVGRGKVGRLLENLTETCHKKRHGSWQRKKHQYGNSVYEGTLEKMLHPMDKGNLKGRYSGSAKLGNMQSGGSSSKEGKLSSLDLLLPDSVKDSNGAKNTLEGRKLVELKAPEPSKDRRQRDELSKSCHGKLEASRSTASDHQKAEPIRSPEKCERGRRRSTKDELSKSEHGGSARRRNARRDLYNKCRPTRQRRTHSLSPESSARRHSGSELSPVRPFKRNNSAELSPKHKSPNSGHNVHTGLRKVSSVGRIARRSSKGELFPIEDPPRTNSNRRSGADDRIVALDRRANERWSGSDNSRSEEPRRGVCRSPRIKSELAMSEHTGIALAMTNEYGARRSHSRSGSRRSPVRRSGSSDGLSKGMKRVESSGGLSSGMSRVESSGGLSNSMKRVESSGGLSSAMKRVESNGGLASSMKRVESTGGLPRAMKKSGSSDMLGPSSHSSRGRKKQMMVVSESRAFRRSESSENTDGMKRVSSSGSSSGMRRIQSAAGRGMERGPKPPSSKPHQDIDGLLHQILGRRGV